MNKLILASAISAVGGALVGSLVTFNVIRRKAQEEVDSVRLFYANQSARFYQAEDFAEKVSIGKQIVENFGYGSSKPKDVDGDALSAADITSGTLPVSRLDSMMAEKSIWDSRHILDENGDVIEDPQEYGLPEGYEVIEGKPYIISQEEFMQDHMEFEKVSLTWYEGDRILAGDDDIPSDDPDSLIGNRHLEMFGIRSDDESIVYVRNESVGSDFEITHVADSYAVRVLGADEDDLEDTGPHRVKRKRDVS